MKTKLRINASYIVDRTVANFFDIESIILSGFWRSGTTWLQTALANAWDAKTIFEPLEPSSLMPLYLDRSNEFGAFIPLNTNDFSPSDWRFLDAAFKGISPRRSGFNYLCRDSVMDAVKPRVVIKFVRSQFLLAQLKIRYRPIATVHISRHPFAVLQSLKKTSWKWNFSEVRFRDFYSNASDISEEMCWDLERLISLDDAQAELKAAAFWAITEKHVRKVSDVNFLVYEEIIGDPEGTLRGLFQLCGLSQPSEVEFSKDSPVTEFDRIGSTVNDRLYSWKREMNKDERAVISKTMREFWACVDDYWELS